MKKKTEKIYISNGVLQKFNNRFSVPEFSNDTIFMIKNHDFLKILLKYRTSNEICVH